jgi:site-specific DNA recombinase
MEGAAMDERPIRRRRKRRKVGAAAERVVVTYARVSTSGQAVHGASLAAQRETIAAWAQRMGGLRIVAEFSDVQSGTRTDKRDGLRRAIAAACENGAILACASLSRLARSSADLYAISGQLAACGADLASASPSEPIDTSTAQGKIAFAIFGALAEVEADMTRERTATVHAHLRRQHRRTSRYAPFGWDFGGDDGRALVRNESEQSAIADMRAMRAEKKTYRGIAAELEARGIPTKQGAATWQPSVVSDVLARAGAA